MTWQAKRRMITGIGTPISHNSMPLPTAVLPCGVKFAPCGINTAELDPFPLGEAGRLRLVSPA